MLSRGVPALAVAALITMAAAYAQQAVATWPFAVPDSAALLSGTRLPLGTPVSGDTTVTFRMANPKADPAGLFAQQLASAGWSPHSLFSADGTAYLARHSGWEASVLSSSHWPEITLSVHRITH